MLAAFTIVIGLWCCHGVAGLGTRASGHVTISLGTGTVISTIAPGGKIGISPITGWFKPLLGWAPAPR